MKEPTQKIKQIVKMLVIGTFGLKKYELEG
jgi:hypothetical protein